MRKVLIGLLSLAGVLILFAGGVLLFLSTSGLPKYEDMPVPDLEVEVTPEKVEEGLRLASMVCNHCHLDNETRRLTGRRVEDIPPEFGVVYSANITRHPTAGIGSYTDGELARLIRSGVKKDGTYSPPYMPKFPLIADKDLEAIIAFLRSDHPLVQANEKVQKPCEPSLLVKGLSRVAFKPYPYPETTIEVPDTADRVAFGRYVATNRLGCYECHSADFKTNTPLTPETSPGYFGGGNTLLRMDGSVVLSSNITMHKEHGIGTWTEEEFANAVKWGQNPKGGTYEYPMAPYTTMTDKEVNAVFAYLKTVPVLDNQVVRPAQATQ